MRKFILASILLLAANAHVSAQSYTNENNLRADIGYFVRLAIDAYYEVY